MSKEDINVTVPELRFPEFVKDVEWEYVNGDKLFEPISNKNHNSDLPILAITQEQGAIPRELIDYHVSVTDKSIESYKVVEIGDFIVSLRSFQGGIEYSKYLGLCSPAYIILRKRIDVENDFYRYYFKSILFISDLNKNIEGIRDGKMVSYTQFSEILIPKPSKTEQQKIASCLYYLDEVITEHRQKLELLKDHKKGLMQNLFPQEGEKVPKYRFPEFKKDGEWVEKKLGELLVFKNGINAEKEQYGRGVKFINVLDILQNEFITYDKIIGSVNVSSETIEKFSVNYGDILFQRSSETQEEAGTANVYLDKKQTATFGGFVIRGKKIGEYEPVFINNLLKSKFVRHSISSKAGGSTRFNIGQEILSSIKILLPSLKEQLKIASCLSSLDELITAQTKKIAQLKLHKKGLMQGLFPKINDWK